MKRIDDKIKEIEKKDKRSRILFYIVVALLVGFLWYASTTRKEMDIKDAEISELTIKNSKYYKELDSINEQTEILYKNLKSSLRPKEYWEHIKNENLVEGYISYISNDWGIDKEEYIPMAIENLKLNIPEGFEGWLWVGSKKNDNIYKSRDIIEIIHRHNYEGDQSLLKNLEPKIGDIVKLRTTSNRKTYGNKYMSGANKEGWRNKTKAFVTDVYKEPNSINFNIRISYY